MDTGSKEAALFSGDGMPVPDRLVLDTERSVSSTTSLETGNRLSRVYESLVVRVRQHPIRAVWVGLVAGLITGILIRR